MGHYHLLPFEYRLVASAIALPSIAVWFVAFWGYGKLYEYSQAIIKSKEGPHFNRMAIGSSWLAWSLPIVMICSFTLTHLSNKWPTFHNTAIIISNYVSLIVPLVALAIISSASSGLIGKARLNLSPKSVRYIMLLFLAVGVAYCFLIFRSLDLTSIASANNPYYLPVWLLILTVIIPYLYAWFIGLLAAYEITQFTINIKGLLYKRALQFLAIGLVVIIVSAIAIQYTSSVFPRTGVLVINERLFLNLALHILSGAGFIIMAIGANRLKKIEEV
jgi:hypothetical protein